MLLHKIAECSILKVRGCPKPSPFRALVNHAGSKPGLFQSQRLSLKKVSMNMMITTMITMMMRKATEL
jgi:hypothetical protein